MRDGKDLGQGSLANSPGSTQEFDSDDIASIPVEAVLSALDEHIQGISAD